ncbi:hypothetical protein QQG55_44910 [Brugia pahangi]
MCASLLSNTFPSVCCDQRAYHQILPISASVSPLPPFVNYLEHRAVKNYSVISDLQASIQHRDYNLRNVLLSRCAIRDLVCCN